MSLFDWFLPECPVDLTCVFDGLGVVAANATLRDGAYRDANWEYWSISRIGYFNFEAYAYALALLAWVRSESKPPCS